MTHARSVVILALAGSLLAVAQPIASAGPRVPTVAVAGTFARAPRPSLPTTSRFSILRRDGNDAKGPLDLAYARASRGGTKDLLTWGTRGAVSLAQLDPKNGNFAVGIDTNNDRKWDFFQYAFIASGRLRGVLVNTHTNRVVSRKIPTGRRGTKTFTQNVLLSKIGNPKTYRFALFSYFQASPCSKKRACGDAIPNRYPLVPLDHGDPTLSGLVSQTYSTDARSDLKSPVSFTAGDDKFGTGVRAWAVQKRAYGNKVWTAVKTGTLTNPTVYIPGSEGVTYDLRVTATDRQGNSLTARFDRTSFPYDDRNAIVAETSGTWTDHDAVTGAYLGTTRSGVQSSVLTFSWLGGSSLCLLGGPASSGTAQATAVLDGVATVAPADETMLAQPMTQVLCGSFGGTDATPHTLVLTVTSTDEYVVDGLIVSP